MSSAVRFMLAWSAVDTSGRPFYRRGFPARWTRWPLGAASSSPASDEPGRQSLSHKQAMESAYLPRAPLQKRALEGARWSCPSFMPVTRLLQKTRRSPSASNTPQSNALNHSQTHAFQDRHDIVQQPTTSCTTRSPAVLSNELDSTYGVAHVRQLRK